jgi:hypothetical protein
MASYKNQHFVPRCHFKPFTYEGAGKAINLINIVAKMGVKQASVRGQCARHYLYGSDLKIEEMLHEVETYYGHLVHTIISKRSNLDDSDARFLKRFIWLQYHRTEMAARRRALSMADMQDAIFTTRGVREELDLSDKEIIAESLSTCAETWHLVDDLRLVLIENQAAHDFVTSDDPAIFTNRWHLQKLGRQNFGLGSSGALLVLPLTPRICVVCYDHDVYSIPNVGGWAVIRKPEDVYTINVHQYLKCAANLYFSKWEDLKRLEIEFQKSEPWRVAQAWKVIVGELVSEDETGELFREVPRTKPIQGKSILNLQAVYPMVPKWPSILRYRLGATAYSNGSAMGLVRKSIAAAESGLGTPFEKLKL